MRRGFNNRIDSSSESLKDDNEGDETHGHDSLSRLEDHSIGKEEDDNIFQSNNEIRSSHALYCSNKRTKLGKRKLRKVKNTGRDFFQSQAAVSDDSDDDVGEDSDGANSLESFVTASDVEQSMGDMHAVYLQSVRSPLVRRGGFKIPNKLQPVNDLCFDDTNIHFAEEGNHNADVADRTDEEQFLNSFIDDNIVVSLESDPSELEIAEQLLKERRRRNRRKRQSDEQPSAGRKKRRRCIVDFSSDSD
uniref:Uncharacterized protein n=1 Tax=Anopheles maculatus TaxID=74869 RepID=A0A182SGH6_9DIPT